MTRDDKIVLWILTVVAVVFLALAIWAGTVHAQSRDKDQKPIDLKTSNGVIMVDTSKEIVVSDKFDKEPIKLDGKLDGKTPQVLKASDGLVYRFRVQTNEHMLNADSTESEYLIEDVVDADYAELYSNRIVLTDLHGKITEWKNGYRFWTILESEAEHSPSNIYVDAVEGSDYSGAGTEESPYQTCSIINRTAMDAGSYVYFQGLQYFGACQNDTTLIPLSSGSAGLPITYTSYGTGRATITGEAKKAVWGTGYGWEDGTTGYGANTWYHLIAKDDSAHACWDASDSLMTRVYTLATLNGHNKWLIRTAEGATLDTLACWFAAAADTSNVGRSKTSAIKIDSKNYTTVINLNILKGWDGITSTKGECISILGTSDNIVISRCSIDSCGIGIYIVNTASNTRISYSKFNSSISIRSIYARDATTLIYNNTIYGGSTQLYLASENGMTIKNNIFYEPLSNFINSATGQTFTSNHNVFYASSYTNKWNNGTNHSALTGIGGWYAATGQDSTDTSKMTWPKFIGQADSTVTPTDFHLQSTSPAKDAGTYVGLTTDFDGRTLATGDSVDIGAFEYPAYVITVIQGSNGTISPSTAVYDSATSQMFTITPDAGYTIDTLFVDGVPVLKSYSYTFSGISANHTIRASYRAPRGWYVSDTGNDTNAGTSASPWRYVDKVDSAIVVAPLDSVYFKRGVLWTQCLNVRSWVRYTGYGTGYKPRIRPAAITGVNIGVGVNNVILDGLEIWANSGGTNERVVYADSSANNITIKHCVMFTTGGASGSIGFYSVNALSNITLIGDSIRNCPKINISINGIGNSGITIDSLYTYSANTCRFVQIYNAENVSVNHSTGNAFFFRKLSGTVSLQNASYTGYRAGLSNTSSALVFIDTCAVTTGVISNCTYDSTLTGTGIGSLTMTASSGWTVSNSSFTNVSTSYAVLMQRGSSNITLSAVTATRGSSAAICADSCSALTLTDCYAKRGETNYLFTGTTNTVTVSSCVADSAINSSGFGFWDDCYDITVSDCRVDYAADDGYKTSNDCHDIYFYRDYGTNIWGDCFTCHNRNYDIYIIGCVAYNNGYTAMAMVDSSAGYAYNNTFVGNGTDAKSYRGAIYLNVTGVNPVNGKSWVCKNNIIQGSSPYEIGLTSSSAPIVTMDYNLGWETTTGSYATFTATSTHTPVTWADYLATMAALGQETHSIHSDPKFRNKASGDYRTKRNWKGVSITESTVDYLGKKRHATPTMGAYEFYNKNWNEITNIFDNEIKNGEE